MNSAASLIPTLARSELFQKFSRAFTEVTGLPLRIRPCGSGSEPQARRSAGEIECAFGVSETGVGIKCGEEVIAFLTTGRVVAQRMPKAGAGGRRRVSGSERKGARSRTEAEHAGTRGMPRRQFEAALRLLEVFAQHLASMSNIIAMHDRNIDPLPVARAKEYISRNLQEEMSLTDIAKAARASTFYICKLFKKHTGLNLTEYIARLRVERTRELLANPRLRVSEIAFEVGFQSLTHFNRVFRRVVGEAPSAHREHLHLQFAH